MNNKTMLAIIVRSPRIEEFTTISIEKIKYLRDVGVDVTILVESSQYPTVKSLLLEHNEPDVLVKLIGNAGTSEETVVQLLCTTTGNEKYTSLYVTDIDFLVSIDMTRDAVDALNAITDKVILVNGEDTILIGGNSTLLRAAFRKPHNKKIFKVYKPRSKKMNTVKQYLTSIAEK